MEARRDPLSFHPTRKLIPHCPGRVETGTGALAVVWLTKEDSNTATADDVEHIQRVAHVQMKEGDRLYGGTARLAVKLERHDKRLIRYSDFCLKSGVGEIRNAITRKAWTTWWVYLGPIPPHKIDMGVSPQIALECLDHHIATHPDIAARARFKMQRDQVAKMPSTEIVRFNVASE